MVMTPAQHRIVDQVLTTHARGYSNAAMAFVGSVLFPDVMQAARGMRRIEFGKEALRRYKTRRAPGAEINRVQIGYEGKPITLEQHAIGCAVPEEYVQDTERGPGIDLKREAVNTSAAIIELAHERRSAEAARDPANYGANNVEALVGAAKFSDPDSDPLAYIEDKKELVRGECGYRPNTFVPSASVASKLRVHPKIRDHFKYTTSAAVTDADLKAYFQVEHFAVANAVEATGLDDAIEDVWGDDCVLAFVNHNDNRTMRQPSYGYTFQLRGYPIVTPIEWRKDVRSWEGEHLDEWSPEVVGPDSGFLIRNAI